MTTGTGGLDVMIVDDHEMFADGIARILADEPDIRVVGTAQTVDRGVALARSAQPSIAVVDYCLPDSQGGDVIRRILQASPDTGVVVLTGSAEARTLTDAVAAGCRGFVTKDRASYELIQAVRYVQAGEVFITQRMLANLLPKFSRPAPRIGRDLTDRELNILALVTEGLTNQDIARQLFLSVHTIRNHVQSVLSKLNAHSRLEAVIVAGREGLLDGVSRSMSAGDGRADDASRERGRPRI